MASQSGPTRLGTLALTAIFAVLLLLCATVYCAWWYYDYAWTPGPDVKSETAVVEIPKGSSVKQIQKILAKNKIINDDFRFLVMTRLSGRSGHLQAGEFLLPTGALPSEIIYLLSTAHSVEYSITIPEGKNIRETAELFAKKGWCDAERFIKLCHDKDFIATFGMAGVTSLEGYLYPATYSVPKKMQNAEKLISLMVGTFRNVWRDLIAGRQPLPDRNQVVTMASMIEKETSAGFERPIIAGVFFNRLKKGMRLQSDPTAVYGMEGFDGKITRKMLRRKTPYNTYVISGLPVGPICNPGKAAMAAVLDPADTDTFYFVAKGDGTHQFSRTLKEHNKAIREFLRKSN